MKIVCFSHGSRLALQQLEVPNLARTMLSLGKIIYIQLNKDPKRRFLNEEQHVLLRTQGSWSVLRELGPLFGVLLRTRRERENATIGSSKSVSLTDYYIP